METLEKIEQDAKALKQPHFPWPIVTPEMKSAVIATMDGGFSLAARTQVATELEDDFRSYVGSKYAVALNSGTSALLSIFDGIGIQPGDEVIVPAYTFFATASPLLILGGVPIFADCRRDGNIDPADIARKVTSKTKAVMVTHQWGIPCEMDTILEICTKNNILLLEDCSRAHGAKFRGKPVGTFGIAAAFSFQANKIISGGEGGILVTNDSTIFYRTILLSTLGQRSFDQIPPTHPLHSHHFAGFGLNHRIHPLAATIARQQLSHLDTWLRQKSVFVTQFQSAVKSIPFLTLPVYDPESSQPAWYGFVMQFVPDRCTVSIEEFLNQLHRLGLTEFERPGMLGQDVHDLPLFLRPAEIWPKLWAGVEMKAQGPFEQASKFVQNAIKLPVWVRESDQEIVSVYIKGLIAVGKKVAK